MSTVSKTDVARLEKLFVRRSFNGARIVCDNLTTPHATLKDLHALSRKGLITYEEEATYKQIFGVLAWSIKLTEAGKIALKETSE